MGTTAQHDLSQRLLRAVDGHGDERFQEYIFDGQNASDFRCRWTMHCKPVVAFGTLKICKSGRGDRVDDQLRVHLAAFAHAAAPYRSDPIIVSLP